MSTSLPFSLASPLTIRVVLASGPVLIFLFQLIEGRLSASPSPCGGITLCNGRDRGGRCTASRHPH
jgi:mannitol-specific phosphotransferase system IIBC component